MAFIDWFCGSIPCTLPEYAHEYLTGGRIKSTFQDGSLEYEVVKRLQVRASSSGVMQIRPYGFEALDLSGCPAKFLYGQNVSGGVADIRECASSIMDAVLDVTGIGSIKYDLEETKLSYIDITQNYDLGSREAALEYLRYLGSVAVVRNRGNARAFKEGTVYLTHTSRLWEGKAYHKGDEIRANARKMISPAKKKDKVYIKSFLQEVEEFAQKCDSIVRIEFRLKSMHLDAKGLRQIKAWESDTVESLYTQHLNFVTVPDNIQKEQSELDQLPLRLRGAYERWSAGRDLRFEMSKTRFYKYRAEILAIIGVDIRSTRAATPVVEVPYVKVPHPRDLSIFDAAPVHRVFN